MAGIKKGGVRKTSGIKSGGIKSGGGYKKATVSAAPKKAAPAASKPKKKGGFFGKTKSKLKNKVRSRREGGESVSPAKNKPMSFASRKRRAFGRGKEAKQPETFGQKKKRLNRGLAAAGASGATAYQGFKKPNPAELQPIGAKIRTFNKAEDYDKNIH